ncbi:MAG TPA: transposase [Methylomusa anaerophila]|uniref:Transposase IS200 like protein n=1 Tax=Methylomusa anaerophila TaxID=1930071 RepID=A0A348AG73_9FIRM|nr:transposase [Methylomusa anaerophila]BBB90071.1 transposase IS200 like protein [Methylomusa anaerophila]HML88203.1 transposase [Methylomusa anaerophila]
MPRQGRRLSESKIYHVMIRGNEKKNIFLNDEDKIHFLDTLCEKNKERRYTVYAYCLMDNHVHLLINEGSDEIAKIMKRINTSYAYYFNKKYCRIGHLFQDRFKSEAIESDAYLLLAVRYLHNNPVKAGIVESAAEYKWSSYNIYVQKSIQPCVVDREFILKLFADDIESAIRLFEEYSNTQSDEQFIDLAKEEIAAKPIQTEKQARELTASYLVQNNIGLNDLKARENENLRRDLISKLKRESSLSIRQIANLLGINRNIVQRTK